MKEKCLAESLVALYEQIFYVFPLFVFYYCVIENMQHVYCTWLNALFALVASGPPPLIYGLKAPLATVIRTSYFPCISCACDLGMWKKTFAWYWKKIPPPDVKHGESDLTRSKPASIVCVPAPHLLPVLHVACHFGSRAELLTVNNNVKMLSLVPYRFFFLLFHHEYYLVCFFFLLFWRLWLRGTLSYNTAQLLKTAKLNVLEFPCVVL